MRATREKWIGVADAVYIDLKVMDFEESYWSAESTFRVRTACWLARIGYAGIQRDQGTPYLEHPHSVARILHSELRVGDPELLIVGLLHDLLEVRPHLEPRVRAALGDGVGDALVALTPEHRLQQRTRLPSDTACFQAKVRRLTAPLLAVRLADRLANLRDLRFAPRERHTRFIADLIGFTLPLAQQRQGEMETLSLVATLILRELSAFHMVVSSPVVS